MKGIRLIGSILLSIATTVTVGYVLSIVVTALVRTLLTGGIASGVMSLLLIGFALFTSVCAGIWVFGITKPTRKVKMIHVESVGTKFK